MQKVILCIMKLSKYLDQLRKKRGAMSRFMKSLSLDPSAISRIYLRKKDGEFVDMKLSTMLAIRKASKGEVSDLDDFII